MASNLVIVESPAKAGTIQKYLGADFTVKPSIGHIRDLKESGISIDIENGFKPEYVVPAAKKKVVSELKALAKKADTVWLASDEDREGEAISWHLYETLGLKKENTHRIVFHEITKPAILSAIEHPREIDMKLVDAQQARRVLDRLVGFELSPVLWRKVQPKLSAGRVQSVALRLIVDKEREVNAFEAAPYYRIEATFQPEGSKATVHALLDKKFKTIDEARKFLEDCIDAAFSVSEVEKKEASRYPSAPFTTSTLQQEASRKLHMPVGITMGVAQKLYEAGLITYMRTDSVNLSSLALGAAKKYICEVYGEEYSKPRQFKTSSKGAQEAHEAIRPTHIEHPSINGTPQEQKLYSLIWKRTVASQMADAKVLKTDIKISSDRRSEKFGVQALQILFPGFMKLYQESTDDDSSSEDGQVILPDIAVGTPMHQEGISALCKYTAAPSRYSEATLVKKLEDLEIGRPSTYATIISTLTKTRGYVAKGDKEGVAKTVTNLSLSKGVISSCEKTEIVGAERGKLIPQEIGMQVSDFLVKNFPEVMDYGFTASCEGEFDRIAEGEIAWNALISSFYGPFHESVQKTLDSKEYNHVERELGVDPADGKKIVAKFGKFGPYIQKGEGEDRTFAHLDAGQLIENITLEQALKLFALPRTVGRINGVDVICTKGRFGPYIKYGDKNASLPRGLKPETVTLEQCAEIIAAAASKPSQEVLKEFPGDIKIINGRYGAYLKHDGGNYRLPKGTEVESLTEEDCKNIIASVKPTGIRKK